MTREQSGRKSAEVKKGGQSKITTIRLDNQTKYFVELAARIETRTVNSFIEWATKKAFEQVLIAEKQTLHDVMGDLWHGDEILRFANLAFRFPRWLDDREQSIWQLMQSHPIFWNTAQKNKDGKITFNSTRQDHLDYEQVRACWEHLKAVAEGKADPLPSWKNLKSDKK